LKVQSNRLKTVLLCAALFPLVTGYCQSADQTSGSAHEPLQLVQTYQLSATIKGHFDHFEVDLKRNRLFSAAEDSKAVLVLDITSGKLTHQIEGLVRPHAILYRADIDRLYITDGGDGSVKVYDGETYRQIARIPLLKDADSIGYDISRN
jgi:DNA-binding beta-propeller fold protein YncE